MHPPPLVALDYIGPVVGALLYVLTVSLAKEPARRTINALVAAGAGGVYLSGGFGLWELLYPLVATPIVYFGLSSYRWIAFAWLMHSGWDVVHYFWGNPIWPFLPTSSFGCAVFDTALALWMLAGARRFFASSSEREHLVGHTSPAA